MQRERTTSLYPLDLELIASLLHLWLFSFLHSWAKIITFMVSGFDPFVIKSYYIYGQFFITFMMVLQLWVIQRQTFCAMSKI